MKIDYPHLYEITNERSAKNQKYFLNGIRAEYALLIFIAVNSSLSYMEKYSVNLVLFVLLIMLLLVRNIINFEQKWYKYRAVTESIKTTTWKFAMKAEPFNGSEEINDAKEGANKQVISSQADSLIKISRIWADFFPANTSNQPI